MKKYVIYLDDEIESHGDLEDFIESLEVPEGYELMIYQDPGEAFSFIRENLQDLRLVISDYVMPVMDGISFLSKIKELNPDIDLVLISNLPDVENAEGVDFLRGVYAKFNPLLDLLQKVINENLRE